MAASSPNEIRRGGFSPALERPEGLVGERAAAIFEHGFLTLCTPKAEEVKPKQIKISAAPTDTQPEHELAGAGSGR
ncbi:MAG TPA: hypothetical protein VIK38_01860 [Coriobacteriia bacterium]|jgi:HSP20 family molecular chaperone IbpA